MRLILLASAAMLLVTGCSQKGADADGDGKITKEEAQTAMAKGGTMAMKPGEWEIKVSFAEIEGDGIPEQAKAMMKTQMAKGITSKTCMTEEDVKKPGSNMFGSPDDGNCTFQKLDRSGNSMSLEMTCKPKGGMTLNSKIEGSFQAESYEMKMEQQMDGPPMGKMTMKGKVEGRRLGDCPA